MKALLMYKDRDFNPKQALPSNEAELIQDLELNTLFNAMARNDKFLFEIAKTAILTGCNDLDTIRYRQNILQDCLKNPDVIRQIYQIPLDAVESGHRGWLGVYSSFPNAILSGAVDLMQMFVILLHKLKNIADENADKFESEGFKAFFAMINRELDNEFFAEVQDHLKRLKFNSGFLLTAELGPGNEGKNYNLRRTPDQQKWTKRIFSQKYPVYSFSIAPRDESGTRALGELRDRGINLVANALAQSVDHIDNFLKMLRIELAFYMGCLNLYERLAQLEENITFPLPAAPDEHHHSFQGLYDVCLAITMKQKTVGNSINADNKDLVIITGANLGGKSTFLRSIGLAQLMMQCGMFVPAESFSANLCTRLFTHYKRKEDATMKSGKLDEELSRMSVIVSRLTPNSLVLFNESFAATNEREGSEIARQITSALVEREIKVFFVTHQYEFAHSFYDRKLKNAIFLRAGRQTGGGRTFKLSEGEPLQTSFGEDVYNKIFRAGG